MKQLTPASRAEIQEVCSRSHRSVPVHRPVASCRNQECPRAVSRDAARRRAELRTAGASDMVRFGAISSVTGTVSEPAEELIVIELE